MSGSEAKIRNPNALNTINPGISVMMSGPVPWVRLRDGAGTGMGMGVGIGVNTGPARNSPPGTGREPRGPGRERAAGPCRGARPAYGPPHPEGTGPGRAESRGGRPVRAGTGVGPRWRPCRPGDALKRRSPARGPCHEGGYAPAGGTP